MKGVIAYTQSFFIALFILTLTFCLASSGILNGLDAYGTRFQGGFGGSGSDIGGTNGVGNGGFCTINPSDPSCPSPQPTQPTNCDTNPNNSSCTRPCPTIALAMPCSAAPPSPCTNDQTFDPSTSKCTPDNCPPGFHLRNGTCVRNLQPGNSNGDGS